MGTDAKARHTVQSTGVHADLVDNLQGTRWPYRRVSFNGAQRRNGGTAAVMHSDTSIKLDRRRNALFALLTSVFVGVYWKCLRNGLVYDDRRAIVENPVFESKDLLDLARNIWSCDFWGTPYTQETSHKSWRPLTTGVFVLQSTAAAFCGVPVEAVYHAVSVALHSVNGLLVYTVADKSGIRLPGLAAGVFWLHPVTIESVCPAVGQADLIPTAILLAVLADLKCSLS